MGLVTVYSVADSGTLCIFKFGDRMLIIRAGLYRHLIGRGKQHSDYASGDCSHQGDREIEFNSLKTQTLKAVTVKIVGSGTNLAQYCERKLEKISTHNDKNWHKYHKTLKINHLRG